MRDATFGLVFAFSVVAATAVVIGLVFLLSFFLGWWAFLPVYVVFFFAVWAVGSTL